MSKLDETRNDWTIGFAGAGLRPFALLVCPHCQCKTYFDVGNGRTPRAFCCVNEPSYPSGDKWTAHLSARPRTPETEAELIGEHVALRVIRPSLIITKQRSASSLFRRNKK